MNHQSSKPPVYSFASAAIATMAIGNPAIATANELQLSAQQPEIVRSLDGDAKAARATFESNVYIVELADDAVATYMGGTEGLAPTSNRATGATKLDTNSEASRSYAAYLRKKQQAFIEHCEAAFGHDIPVRYEYQHAFNGVALELSPEEAKAMQSLSVVKNVTRESFEVMDTDAGPQWINAPRIWGDKWPRHGKHSKGEGIVVAILDSGINSDHPSFADIGGDGYDHTNPLGSGNYVPGSHCDAANPLGDPSFCNDKLIGAWDMTGPADGSTPEDTDGHGSHTAATAAGNVISQATLFAPTTELTRNLSGVAPHANIIMYDVCIDSCPGSALLAAINQVVIDSANIPGGIHALNYSISGGNSPYTDAVELGFLNATAAGIYVAASAGNTGPGPSTNGHNGPWVSTTAALTHNRDTVNGVVGLTSDGSPLADIAGVGLTSGYGPAPIINSADLEGAFPGSTLCGLGAQGDFNPPWPPGTFNGEIVACTRGTYGRVEKGANVLAAGAGGYILMDTGAGISADAHVLPGTHISQADSAVLTAWLASNANPMGSISAYSVSLDESNGDIMAGFSSRGPNTINVIKPDIGGPGVAVFAAEANGQAPAPEYQLLSGTSMSSPHNAGSGALLSAVQPSWTPYEIRSALMMTSERYSTLKEDGSTPTDPFDVGAGRIDLSRAQDAGLVLNETPENFLAANPATGGDPRTLNLASMQDDNCVGTCSWTRTVRNVTGHTGHWVLKTVDNGGLELTVGDSDQFSHHENRLKIKKGGSETITVTADTTLAPAGWNFGSLELKQLGNGPDLHMPIAVFASNSSNPDLLTKTVDAATAAQGEPLNYEIRIVNGKLAGQIDLEDQLPPELDIVPGSLTETIAGGTTIAPFSDAGGTLTWSGTLDVGGLVINQSPSPFGFFPLASLGVPPSACPSNCDDGAFIVTLPSPFRYNGQDYTQVIWSINGALEAGTASLRAASATNQNFPSPTLPNNLLAPFWTDLNLGQDTLGRWYRANLTAGPNSYSVFEWNNVPFFGDPTNRYSFQIWIQRGDSGNIWFTYGPLGTVNTPSGVTVGAEDSTGSQGVNYFFEGTGTAPATGVDLRVALQTGGTATFTFQAELGRCRGGEAIVNRVNVSTETTADTAIAVTQCVDDGKSHKRKRRHHGYGDDRWGW